MRGLIAAAVLIAAPAFADVNIEARVLYDIRLEINPAAHVRVFETHSATTLRRIEEGSGSANQFVGLSRDPVEFVRRTPTGAGGVFVNRHLTGGIADIYGPDQGRQLVHGIHKSALEVHNLGPDIESVVLIVDYVLQTSRSVDGSGIGMGRVDILFELDTEQIGYASLVTVREGDPTRDATQFVYQLQIPPGTGPAEITITTATVSYAAQTP